MTNPGDSKFLPPLGDPHDKARRCMRHIAEDDQGREIVCGKPAIRHIIFWWREAAEGEHPDDCWDNGFACAEHWREFGKRWSCAAAHALTPACGMPGSRCHFEENTCTFDDLPTVEPERVIAVARELTAA